MLAMARPQSTAAAHLTRQTFPNTPDNPYGANVFLHKEVEPWKIEQTLRMAAQANIAWIKQEFSWQEIEFGKGYFYDDKWQKSAWEKFDRIVELAERYNLNVVARVSHPPGWAKAEAGGAAPLKDNKDLADFINALLDHYKGRIRHVQVWNEPNLSAEWVPGKPVDPRGYADLLKVVYPAVKAAHPEAVILSAPMAMTLEGTAARGNMNEIDYWNGLYEAGVKGYFDVVSANGYGLDMPPEAPPDAKVLNFRRVELLRQIMERYGDGDKQIWFNEYGWNASPESLPPAERNYWRHVTPQQQAEWTVGGIEYARKNWPWAGVFFIWYLRQVGDIPPEKAEFYFGMVYPDFSAQPVYSSVRDAARGYPGPASRPLPNAIYPPPTPTPVAVPQATPTAARPVSTPTPRPAAPTATSPAPTPTPEPVEEASPVQVTATPVLVEASPTPRAGTPTATATIVAPEPTATATPPTVVEADNPNIWLFVLGGALVLAGLAALGYYLMRSRNQRSVTSDQ